MRKLIAFLSLTMFVSVAQAAVKGEEVTYKQGDTSMTGYIAYDDSIKGKRPGVIVVHEWWGHNEYVRKRADMLAELGYIAFAIDMYGDGQTADHPKDAGKFAGQVRSNMPVAEARFKAALEQLNKHPMTNKGKTAAIGYCFGGGIVLEMARRGANLDGVVSFHGSLNTDNPAQKGKVKSRVLVLNGEADPMVKPEQVDAFKKEMENARVKYEFVNYPGALHAFTNPAATENGKKFNLPIAYDEAADKASWEKMQGFLKTVLK